MLFLGQPDSSYSFYAVAVDDVGNPEVKSPVAEASVKVPPLGITERGTQTPLAVLFPNPLQDIMHVRLVSQSSSNVKISVETPTGQLVKQVGDASFHKGQTIDFSTYGIPAGVYLVKFRNAEGLHQTLRLSIIH